MTGGVRAVGQGRGTPMGFGTGIEPESRRVKNTDETARRATVEVT